jgi:hypothetical protein
MQSHTNALSAIAVLLPGDSSRSQEAAPPVVWHDRGDAAALNLLSGPGGPDREPGMDFRFIRESVNGTSPKFEVQDENGVTWKAKLGEEVHGETAAAGCSGLPATLWTRTITGRRSTVRGMEKLTRGQQFVSADGIVTGVRLERDSGKAESSTWSWYDNPLVGTREFNGLRVMMALINNWDLKAVNNGAIATDGGASTASPTSARPSAAPATPCAGARVWRRSTRRAASSTR